jgi:hypothetical protein
MKKYLIIIHFVLLFIVGVGCKPDAFEAVGEPFNKAQALTGNWKLNQVIQTDLVAQRYNYTDPSRADISLVSMDVTNVVPYTDFKMSINIGTNDTTFSTTPGAAPRIIRFANGKLSFNDKENPSQLRFINGTDTVRMDIGNYSSLKISNMLTLSLTRYEGDKAVLRYDYKFSKN